MSLPPAGWYDDPTDPVMQRWWDGDKWTEHRRPTTPNVTEGAVAPRSGDLRDVGDMISHTFSLIRLRLRGIIGVGVLAALAIAVAYGVAIVAALGLAFDFDGSGFSDVDGGVVLLLIVLFAAAGILAVASFLATTTMLWDAAVGRQRPWGAALANGFRRLFPFLGWMFIGSVPIYGVILLIAAVSGGGAGDAFSLLFLLAIVPLMYWAVVLYFVPVIVIRETGENPVMAAFQLVRGRWWRIYGRMLAWGLIMIGIGLGLGIVFSIVTAAAGGEGGPAGAVAATIVAVIGLMAFFLFYALQAAPLVSITYDLVGAGTDPGEPTLGFGD